jgi:hypothetical protein
MKPKKEEEKTKKDSPSVELKLIVGLLLILTSVSTDNVKYGLTVIENLIDESEQAMEMLIELNGPTIIALTLLGELTMPEGSATLLKMVMSEDEDVKASSIETLLNEANFRLITSGIERASNTETLGDLTIILQRITDSEPVKVQSLISSSTIEKLYSTF